MKTKIIRGRPVYIYKGSQWLEQPEKTIIKSMVYNQDENVTYVKVGKPSILVELISVLIILGCITINIVTNWGSDLLKVRFSSVPVYYNDNLYINLYVENSTHDVTYVIKSEDKIIHRDTLSKGDLVVTLPLDNYEEKLVLVLETKNILGSTVSDEYKLTVVNKEISNEE